MPLVCQLSGLGNCLFKVWDSYQKPKIDQEWKGALRTAGVGEGGDISKKRKSNWNRNWILDMLSQDTSWP